METLRKQDDCLHLKVLLVLPRKGGGDLQLSAGHLERSKLDVVWQEGWPWSAPGKVSLTSLNLTWVCYEDWM